MQTERLPYEFLVRWGDDGQIKGAHIKWMNRLLSEDGLLLASQESEPQTISVAGAEGFPLDIILDVVLKSALRRIEELEAMVAAPPENQE